MKRTLTVGIALGIAMTFGLLTRASVPTGLRGSDAAPPWTQTGAALLVIAAAAGAGLATWAAWVAWQRVPHDRVRLVAGGLVGWGVGCVSSALLVSYGQALELAFGAQRLLTPHDWIVWRGVLIGLTAALVPGALMLRWGRAGHTTAG